MSSRSRRLSPSRSKTSGFTLVELLVVISIVLLASLVALPVVYSSLSGRQITDAARIFTGGLVGIRDAAIRYNEPRGIRLLPDPVLTIPAPGAANAGSLQLVYNRFIPIEPAGDYSDGKVSIGPLRPVSGTFPPVYPRGSTTTVYPFPDPTIPVPTAKVLMIEESPFAGGFVIPDPLKVKPTPQPNSPTNWYWNVRLGDKIKVGGTGRAYTVVGPCVVNPWNDFSGQSYGLGNPELFVNVGPPGTPSPLLRTAYYSDGTFAVRNYQPEFLFVVNGEDDDLDGYVDDGWDGYNQDGDFLADGITSNVDNVAEWETEKWVGPAGGNDVLDPTATTDSPSLDWINKKYQSGTHDVGYIINRRPVPSQGSREVMLPAGMVIDATTWNVRGGQERSRIPVEDGSLYCDVMVNPNGLYIPTTAYSSPTSAAISPFLHFWLTNREDVHPRGSVWGVNASGVPNPNPSNTATETFYELPLGPDTAGYPARASDPILKGDRRLVTMFTQSGLVVTNTIETIASPNSYQPGEGFNVKDVGFPFYKAQLGLREAR